MDKENLQQKDSFKIESISVNNKTYELQENNSCIVLMVRFIVQRNRNPLFVLLVSGLGLSLQLSLYFSCICSVVMVDSL